MRCLPRIRVLIADDHRLFRQGLRALLGRCKEIEIAGEARDGEEAVLLSRKTRPDVLLLDLEMPVLDGLAVTRIVTAGSVRPKVIILSSYEDDTRVFAAMQAGASAYVAKRVDVRELISIVKEIVSGHSVVSPFLPHVELQNGHALGASSVSTPDHLTSRECEVLRLLAQGNSNEEIAQLAHMSRDTVKAYLKAIFEKLQVKNRTQAAVMALRCGILTPKGPAERTGRLGSAPRHPIG